MDYTEKIAELDARLEEMRTDKVTQAKRQAMAARNYNDDQIERYLSHIEGATADEISASITQLAESIPPQVTYVDPPLGNTARQTTTSSTPERRAQAGKRAFERIKDKIGRPLF
ncbi:hypothetical protein [Sporosarcina sp. OR05]|uniref:hypothetical protein n=1 Tax=Sporosarcina sp. OR05 TaxID=2969819 RepID=UPI00352AC7A0